MNAPANKVFSLGSITQRSASTADCEKAMRDDLAKSGLEPLDLAATIGAAPYYPEVEVEGEDKTVNASVYANAHYRFPMFRPDGSPIADCFIYKVFYVDKAPKEVSKRKYLRPSKRAVGELANAPYMPPGRVLNAAPILDIHEGEKKSVCAVKHGQRAIGIAGCWNWKEGKGKSEVHHWILEEIEALKAATGERVTVRIWPDADFLTNHDVQTAYSAFANGFSGLDVDVVLMDLSAVRVGGKFDDLVTELGYEAVMAGVTTVSPTDLMENPSALGGRYGLLMSKPSKDAHPKPQAIDCNYSALLAKYPLFLGADGRSLIWYNKDTGFPMLGTEKWTDSVDDSWVLHLFQRQLGFNGRGYTAKRSDIQYAIGSHMMSHQRSPFEERVIAAASKLRDGGYEPLLDEWAVRFLHAPDTEFNRRWGRKLLVALIGRAFNPGCDLRTVFCICGPQGVGKTHFMRSFVGAESNVIISPANSGGKDLAMTYSGALVAVFDEMGAIKGREAEHVKSDISTTHDSIRPPYGKTNVLMPRRCIYLIPVDRLDFLPDDAAGLTRFAVLDLLSEPAGRFDFAGLDAVTEQLLGEAYLAVRSGEEFAEFEGADDMAQGYTSPDAMVEQIRHLIEKGQLKTVRGDYNGTDTVVIKLIDVLNALGMDGVRGRATEVVAGPLRKLGFNHAGRNKAPLGVKRGWFVRGEEFDGEFDVQIKTPAKP